MGRYLVLWELDQSRMPVDAKERSDAWSLMMDIVKQDMEAGMIKDWGTFVGESSGYDVAEGTEVEVGAMCAKFMPYVSYNVHPIASWSQVDQIIKSLSG